MVFSISINMDTRKVRNMFTGFTRTIPEGADIGARKLAKKAVSLLKKHAKMAGIKHWGGGAKQLLGPNSTTRTKRIGKNNYVIIMPIHGKFLDSMRPHTVWLKRGRLITKWARDRGIKGFVMKNLSEQMGTTERGISVRPHPFIRSATTALINITKSRHRNPIRREISKKIVRKGTR